MTGIVLVLNAGSSSLKFAAYGHDAASLRLLTSGQVEGIGASPRFVARDGTGARVADQQSVCLDKGGGGHAAAVGIVIDWLEQCLSDQPVTAVGHRVVHGGPTYAEPVLIDLHVLADLQELVSLAPLHQPHNLAGIAAAARRFRGVPQVACFDTAFHRTQPWEAETFGLPPHFYDNGIRRYGFHGLSYEFIARRIAAEDPALGAGRLVVAHLGNGSSLCAIQAGRGVASTMGFTALDGVPMGTRCGQIDPGVLLHLLNTMNMSAADVTKLLYNDSGLKGLSGVSQDVREIEAAGTPEAERALSYFAYRVRKEIGALATTMGGLDALIFTAGIGENAAGIRARVCEGLAFLGIALDAPANGANASQISPPDSAVRVLVRHTDEERMVAEHTAELVSARS